MRLPFVPGPSDVIAAVTDVRDGVAEALALVPRLGAALGRMERYLDRVGALLDRVDGVVDRVDDVVDRADGVIATVTAVQAKADEAIERVGRTTSRADGIVDRADGLVGRLEPLLGDFEPALTSLAPSVRRLAATLDPSEVEAMVTLVDRLPRLVTHLDEDILPVLESLGNVGTDVHDLVDTVQDLRQVVKGFPGSRLFRRRGAEEIAEEEAAGN
jgi:ABC-type transporter Mla subunit MlaD